MSEKIFIYSTLTASQKYTQWKKGKADLSTRDKSVYIQGGSNVPDKHLVTPRGVVTEVTADQLAVLESNPSFKRHKERGFIKVERHKAETMEKAVSDMVQRDPSAPLVPDDYNADDAEKGPKTNKAKTDKAAPPPPKGK
jgi:hypothetical protein